MPGFIIGVVSGAIQFQMLSRFTCAISLGDINTKIVLIAVAQFLLPPVVLICCTLLLPQGLLWAGIGMAATLIICAVTRVVLTIRNGKK